jgi:hypothetical protein
MATGTHTKLANMGVTGGGVSRKIFEDNLGRVYCPTTFQSLMVYNPETDEVERPGVPLGSGFYYSSAVVKSMTGDSIYFIAFPMHNLGSSSGTILRYIPSRNRVENLGPVDPNEGGWRANLHLRWDQNKLYFANNGRLFSLHVITKDRAEVATNMPTRLYGSDGVDKNGDLWFTRAGGATVYRALI